MPHGGRQIQGTILSASAIVIVLLAVPVCRGAIKYTGVNLSGAEFGEQVLPGTSGTNYIYPYSSTSNPSGFDEVKYFVTDKGMNTIRLPFRWERLQPTANGALNSAELTRMKNFVTAVTNRGGYTILDPHNFARYYPSPVSETQTSLSGLLGADVSGDTFKDFWKRVATEFKDNNHVIFNLSNEPSNIDTDQWVGAANKGIEGIREAGATNLILVPGSRYTGAWTWNNANDTAGPHNVNQGRSNAAAMLDIVDSGNNFAFDVHQYMDSNGSGQSTQIDGNNVNTGKNRITDFTNWLIANNRKGFLGEFAVGNSTIGTGGTQIGDEVVNNMLNYMQQNSNVWLGWTWWAAGPWWAGGPDPSHAGQAPMIFLLDPTNAGKVNQTDKAAMPVLTPYLAHPVAGDYNNDGIVDAEDYTVWRDSVGQVGAGLDADGDINGVVNDADYNIWLANFNPGPGAGGGGSSGVPEPSSLVLLALGLAALGACRRYRTCRQ